MSGFVSGTNVLTDSGYVPIDCVTTEYKLMTHTGNFQAIKKLQRKMYSNDLYELKIKHHPLPIMCTTEHPFYVREHFGKSDPVWKSANDLSMSDYVGMAVAERVSATLDCVAPDSFVSSECKMQMCYSTAMGLQRMYLRLCRLASVILVEDEKYEVIVQAGTVDISSGYVWYPIVSIVNMKRMPLTVYNFEVEIDNSYIVEHVIVRN